MHDILLESVTPYLLPQNCIYQSWDLFHVTLSSKGDLFGQTCDAGGGFVPSGSDDTVTRTCTTSGWSGDDITCQR